MMSDADLVGRLLLGSAYRRACRNRRARPYNRGWAYHLVSSLGPSRQRDDDYDVLEDGKVVGRIFHLDAAAREGRPWMWASGHGRQIERAAHLARHSPTYRPRHLRAARLAHVVCLGGVADFMRAALWACFALRGRQGFGVLP